MSLLAGKSLRCWLQAPPWDLAEGGKVVVGCLAPFPEGCFVEGDGAGLHQRFAALVVGGAAV